MPFIPDTMGLARLGFSVTGDAERMYITLGYHVLVGTDLAAHQSAVTALEQDFFDNVVVGAAAMANIYTYHGCEATAAIAGDNVPVVAPRTVVGSSGANTAPPNNCAYLVKKLTAAPGRRNRGRCYVPPFALIDSEVDAVGTITPATVTVFQTRWTAFLTDSLAGGNYELMLLHSTSLLGDAREITSFVVDNRIATQRRRLRK
jgi:hypothetical protein